MPRYEVPPAQRRLARRLRNETTILEEMLWQQLRDRRLDGFKFRRQVPLAGYVADFVCFEAKLIVEVDGPVHAHEEQRLHDKERDRVLRQRGFRVVRFDGETVLTDLERVLGAVRQALAQAPSAEARKP
jgi:very-short-patch-repair endonuclease